MRNLIITDELHNYLDHSLYTKDSLSKVSNEVFKVPFSGDMDIHQYNLILISLKAKFRLMTLDVEYPLDKEIGRNKAYITDGKKTVTLPNANQISQSDLSMISELTGSPIALLSFLLTKVPPMVFIPSVCKTYNLNYVII